MTGKDKSRDSAKVRDTAEPRDTAGEAARSAADPPGAPGAGNEDAKARFKAALDKKNAAAHRSNQGSANTGSVHGSETTGTGKRMFRRKSG